jgi:hypothetical protein
VAGTVYSTTGEVAISTTDNSNQSLLLIEHGVAIDTSAISPSFELPATASAPNYLDYFPSGSRTKLAHLWEFTAAYTFDKASGLNSLVVTDPTAQPQPVTVGGPSVISYDQDDGLQIGNLGGGSTLAPMALYITPGSDSQQIPSALNLSGKVALSGLGSKLAKYFNHLNVSIGDDATYVVRADSVGLVQMVSQSGHGIWIDVTPGSQDLTATFGSVQVHWVRAAIAFDQETKVFSLAGEWAISLKDDAPDQTPFLVSLGDQSNPGLMINFATGQLEHFQASFIAGTSGGQYRGTFGPSGTAITVQGLYFMYDAPSESIGVGGQANMSFGAKDAQGQYENTLTLVLGNPAADQAGMFIQDGRVVKFNGRFTGKRIEVGKAPLTGDITVGYQAGTGGQPGVVNIAGSLSMNLPGGYAVGITFPPNPNGQGLIIKTNGDWDLAGGIGFQISGSAGVKDLSFRFDNLQVTYTRPTNASGGTDSVWHITGGATLSSFFQASVDLTGDGLVIRNGDWDLAGINVYVGNLTAGGFGIEHLAFSYQKDSSGFEVKGEGRISLGVIQVGFFVDFKDGRLSSIGANFKATGEDPGLPVGDTGLFLTGIGFEVDNLDNLSQWAIQGSVSVAYGEGIQFQGHTVRLFTAEGHFKADSSEFVIDQADFAVMDGLLAKGSGSLDLNWVKHQYHVQWDVSGFDGLIDLHADFNLNQFNQVTVYASVGLRVPAGVPFIGGDQLANLEGLLYIDPDNPANDKVAAWLDVNYIFGHLRLGAEFLFYPPPGQDSFHILWGSDVESLEQEATSHPDGYHTTFTPTLAVAGGLPPNQSLFTLEWDNANAIGDVTITIPGVASPVTIPQSEWSSSSPTPVSFTYNGNPYIVQPVKELAGAQRVAWVIGPDASNNPGNALLPLPVGQYTVDFVTAEMLTGKLTHAETFAPPSLTNVTLKQPPNSNQVEIDASYVTADPAATTVDLYYTTDPKGGSGNLIKSIPLDATAPNRGTVSTSWDITKLTWNQPYYVFARISDVAIDDRGNTTKRTSAPVVSATSVSPYADLIVQLKITPDVPVDQQSVTLAGWPVVWQQLGSDGTTVLRTVQSFTDGFGKAGIAAGAGTNWTVVVAPKNWDGFQPLPDQGQGQSADANGQLTTTNLSGGSYASPRTVTVAYQNEVSVQGQVALDLDSSRNLLLGGAGVSGEIVYVDLNNDGQWDPGDPRTSTDLGGYYDLRFPLPDNRQANTYTVRLMPDPSAVNTFVRTNPDSTSDVSFRQGASYTFTVDTSHPNPREVFDDRHFLIEQQFLLSGTAYVSGPNGEAYGPGATPVAGATINLADDTGKPLGSTTTGPDGSYQFAVPGPGVYQVAAASTQPAQVNVPSGRVFGLDGVSSDLNLSLTTPQGETLYPVSLSMPQDSAPVAASGDFFGDGRMSTATLAWSIDPGSVYNLYLVILKGADAKNQITARVVLVQSNFNPETDSIPSVFWSAQFHKVYLLWPGTVKNITYDPITNVVGATDFPPLPGNITQVSAFASGQSSSADAWLLTSNDGNNWALFEGGQEGYSAIFDFSSSNGVRPVAPPYDPTWNETHRWAALTVGDFDGDGVNDYAFSAVDALGKPGIAYLLSRERNASGMFTQVHFLPFDPGRQSPYPYTQSLFAVDVGQGGPGSPSPSWLIVHRRNTVLGTDEVLVYAPQLYTAAQMAQGAPAASFELQSAYDVSNDTLRQRTSEATTDLLADVDGNGLPDLVIAPEETEMYGLTVTVLLNLGGGRFAPQAPVQIQSGGPLGQGGGFGLGLLSAGPGISILGIGQDYDPNVGLGQLLFLGTNNSSATHSYLAEVNSPGSYGGYNFGFNPGQVADGGFETPVVGSGPNAYRYNPTGSPWTFMGSSGVSGNGSLFTNGNPNAPEGSQVAFLQQNGTISQAINFAAGTYTLSFLAAQRQNYQASFQVFDVEIDGSVVGTFTPAGTSYSPYTTASFTVTASSHIISFVGLNPNGGDNTAFIDAVSVQLVSSPTNQVSGVAFVDVNGNGRQDPGEPNLANQLIQVTLVDAQGNVTNQVVATDSAGRYTITGTGLTVLSVNGLSPANSQPAASPPPFPLQLDPAAVFPFSVPAYAVPAGTVGAQEWKGTLGMDFDVNKPVTVTSLGVFDSGQDGLQQKLTATLYDRSTQKALATLTFTPDDPGTLIGGSRYKLLPQPLLLPAGFQGSIVAEGYGPGEPNGNSNLQSPTWTTNPGNDGAISFVDTSRNGPPGTFPTNIDKFVNNYAAGTFLFQPATVGGKGTAVGGGNLIQTLDYADSFTLGTGKRVGLAPNGQPTGDQLNVEYHSPQAPPRAWTTLGQISTDAAAVGVPGLAYPGGSNAGSQDGFVQAPGSSFLGIRYGLRGQYVVQADLVQTPGGVVLSTGPQPGVLSGDGSLTVTFFADDNAVGVTLSNRQGFAETVFDSADGNFDPLDPSLPLKAGTMVDTWNNYAVAFDRINQRLSLYVNNKLLKTLDLTVFASGQFADFSNAAVTVGADDPQRVWLDNFQVGAPYDGYQVAAATSNQTGYDFGIREATTATGGIQGSVVVVNQDNGDPFAPGLPPLAGVTMYLDLNGNGLLSPGDPQTTTDAHGNFKFPGVKPGTYVLRQAAPAGYGVLAVRLSDGTVSGNSSITVDVLGGQTAYANNFSDQLLGSSLGAKFSSEVTSGYVRLVPQDADTTEVQIDIMSGPSVGRTQVVGTYNPHDWRPVGVGDFNGDGQTDLLFQSQRDGSLQFWELNNGQLQGVQSLGVVPPDWQVRATADLGGKKGITDLILRNIQTGELQAWLLDGSGGHTAVPLGTLSLDWAVEGVADVNGDGKPDLLLHDLQTGAVRAWLLDGASVTGQEDLGAIDPAFHLVGSEAWGSAPPAGTYLYWQQEGSNQVTRWDLDYQQGLVATTPNFDLGRTAHAGRYLDSQPANELSPDYQYVRGLYQTLLGRAAESAGLQYWAQQLRTGTSRAQVAAAMWDSPEHRGREVDQYYASYLHRAADAPGRALWVNALRAGASEADVARGLLTSAEYQQAHAGTTAYLFGLYADVLGRAPDPGGLDLWQAAAQAGMSRAALADAFLAAAEAYQRLMDRYYSDYLGRAAEPAGVEYWLEALQSRQWSPAQVAQAFLASDEFFARAGTGLPSAAP